MSRANQWFVLADGIVREVITADITRYLGNDASVRPGMGTGEHEGRRGYWITAYRTLTSAMIDDLQADSRRWEQERRSSSSRNAYQDSRTHADRLHTGPSPSATYPPAAPYDRQPALSGSYVYGSRAGFGKYRDSYSSATVDYGGSQFDYPFVPSAVDPRTTLGPFGSQSSQPPVAFYSTPAPTPTSSPPGYYTASDGRQYPLPQQSQSPAGVNLPENRNSDRRKRSDVTPQATLATYSGTVDPPQTTAVSPTVMRYGKHSDDDGEGAGSMSSPYD